MSIEKLFAVAATLKPLVGLLLARKLNTFALVVAPWGGRAGTSTPIEVLWPEDRKPGCESIGGTLVPTIVLSSEFLSRAPDSQVEATVAGGFALASQIREDLHDWQNRSKEQAAADKAKGVKFLWGDIRQGLCRGLCGKGRGSKVNAFCGKLATPVKASGKREKGLSFDLRGVTLCKPETVETMKGLRAWWSTSLGTDKTGKAISDKAHRDAIAETVKKRAETNKAKAEDAKAGIVKRSFRMTEDVAAWLDTLIEARDGDSVAVFDGIHATSTAKATGKVPVADKKTA